MFPVGVRFIDTGTLGYIPPEFAVVSRTDEAVNASYGATYNPSTEAAVATMEVVFTTHPDSPAGPITFPDPQTIAGGSLNLPTGLTVAARVKNKSH